MAAQMLGSSTTTRTMPRVNLLPPEIAEATTLRRSQYAMGGVGLAAVAVVGALFMNATAKVSDATETKEAAVATNGKLSKELSTLQHVRDTYAQVDAAKLTLASAMQSEILWSSYLHDLTLTIPENVWVETFTTSLTNGASAAATGPAASAAAANVLDPGLGTLNITGYAFTHADLASWLESLAKQKGYNNAFFTVATEQVMGGRTVVKFTSQVNLTTDALSGRYTKGTPR